MTVAVKTFVDPLQLKADVSFTEADLDSAMMSQAALFAHYATQAATAQHQVDSIKLLLEVKEASVAQAIRDEAAESGAKTTEKGIEQQITMNAAVIALRKALNNARSQADLAKMALEALRQKRDMLVQIGVARREEMLGELRIRGAEAAAEARVQAVKERAEKLAQV